MNKKKYFSKKNILIFTSLIVITFIVIFYFFNFNNSKIKVLAKVGTKVITLEDFLLNYEFGFPHLKIGNTTIERKKNYLQFMINEYLLALDAESKQLNLSPDVQFQTERIKKELLLESVIDNDIKKNIKVNPDEIKDAINKSKVSFKFFFWPETDFNNAIIIKEMFEKNGIDETFKKLSGKKSDFHFDYSKYISDYKSWLDIPEETFLAIKDLPVNKFSDPIKIDDLYFIFQVQDIRREAVRNEEYLSKAPTFQKILFNAKLQDGVIDYVDKLVTPKNVRTKARVFNIFADAIIDWHNSKDKNSQSFSNWIKANADNPIVQKYFTYQDSILINYNGGSFTLGEFQKYYYFDKISEEYQTRKQFKNHLNFLIGMSVRDYFMELDAMEKGYDNSPWFEHQFMKWTSKFAFEEIFKNYVAQNTSSNSNIKEKINVDLNLLKSKYDIYINSEMLDTVKVNETQKSKGGAFQLMKSGVNRLAEPIVDGYWKSISN
ncbi:MAG: hypothetical protein IPH62_16890 [Ignavibacteriae bacterium]|nr:hypothetical protein [Ignavibacteriota bacterium]